MRARVISSWQVVREFREFVDVRVHAIHEGFELREDFGDVRGNFGERARKDIEIVVAKSISSSLNPLDDSPCSPGKPVKPRKVSICGAALPGIKLELMRLNSCLS